MSTATSGASLSSYSPFSSSSSSMEQVSKAVVQQRNHQNPEWIEGFLKASFFVSCEAHPYISNHLNRYCVTCQISGSHYCMNSGHPPDDHETLKIYRHVYRDVVLLSEMDKHLDFLPYKSNHSLVIALKPLPHFGGLSKFSCRTCGRRVNPQYSYCCLHCKVAAMSTPFLGDQTTPILPTIGRIRRWLPNPRTHFTDERENPSELHFYEGVPSSLRGPSKD